MTSSFVGGFAQGFANGYTNERKRVLDAETDENQLVLRYKLEELGKEKDTRRKKRELESERANTARNIATRVGSPDFSSDAYQMLNDGYEPSQIETMWTNGQFKKKASGPTTVATTNPDLEANRVSMGMDIPEGVVTPVSNVENVIKTDGTGNLTSRTPVKSNGRAAEVENLPNEPIKSRAEQWADEKIKTDYAFLQDASVESDKPDPVLSSDSNYELIPKNKEFKLDDPGTIAYNLMVAQKEGNQAEVSDLQIQLKAASYAATVGKNIPPTQSRYAALGKDGKIRSYFIGEEIPDAEAPNGVRLVNASVPGKPVVTSNVVQIEKETINQIQNIENKFSKQITEYEKPKAQFIQSLQTYDRMKQIMDRNPSVATEYVGGFLGMLNATGNELGAAAQEFQSLGSMFQGVEALVDKDPEAAAKKANELQKSLNGMLLNDRGRNFAEDRLLFQALKQSLAYQLAAANGQEGTALSQKEIKNFEAMIGGKTKESFEANSKNVLSLTLQKIDTKRAELKRVSSTDSEAISRLLNGQGKSSLDVTRVADDINSMETLSPEDKARLTGTLSSISTGKVPSTYGQPSVSTGQAPVQNQSDPLEGRVATNPKTKERLIRRNGKWEKL